jgi:hypothetical protein
MYLDQLVKQAGAIWDADRTAIYALPDNGAIYFLTPPLKPPLTGQPFAGITALITLTVALSNGQTANLAPGVYTLAGANNEFRLSGIALTGTPVSAIPIRIMLRELAPSPDAPIAFITAQQMCVGWNLQELCAQISIPLRVDLQRRLRDFENSVPLNQEAFEPALAVPDIEGQDAVVTCDQALRVGKPEGCLSNVLATSAAFDQSLPDPHVQGTVRDTGLLVTLKDLVDAVFLDPQLTQSAPGSILPASNYLVYDVRLPSDKSLSNGAKPGRLLFYDPKKDQNYYVPALADLHLIGRPLLGNATPDPRETAILDLWFFQICWQGIFNIECQNWVNSGGPQ